MVSVSRSRDAHRADVPQADRRPVAAAAPGQPADDAVPAAHAHDDAPRTGR